MFEFLLLLVAVNADMCRAGTYGVGGVSPCTACAYGMTSNDGASVCFGACPFSNISALVGGIDPNGNGIGGYVMCGDCSTSGLGAQFGSLDLTWGGNLTTNPDGSCSCNNALNYYGVANQSPCYYNSCPANGDPNAANPMVCDCYPGTLTNCYANTCPTGSYAYRGTTGCTPCPPFTTGNVLFGATFCVIAKL